MRDSYAVPTILAAIDAWERHKTQWLAALDLTHAQKPSDEAIRNYRNIWLEGYMESRSESNAES